MADGMGRDGTGRCRWQTLSSGLESFWVDRHSPKMSTIHRIPLPEAFVDRTARSTKILSCTSILEYAKIFARFRHHGRKFALPLPRPGSAGGQGWDRVGTAGQEGTVRGEGEGSDRTRTGSSQDNGRKLVPECGGLTPNEQTPGLVRGRVVISEGTGLVPDGAEQLAVAGRLPLATTAASRDQRYDYPSLASARHL